MIAHSVDTIAARTLLLQDTLQQSQLLADDAEATLNELEDQLMDLRQATTPIYTRTQALTWARENIEKVRCRADNILEHLDLSRKVEKRIRAGPGSSLDRFLSQVQQLNKAIKFLQGDQTMKSAASALWHAVELQSIAMQHCQTTFRETLISNSVRPDFYHLTQAALEVMEEVRSRNIPESTPHKSPGSIQLKAPMVVAPAAVLTLHRIAEVALRTATDGPNDIIKVYVDCRQHMLEQTLEPSGVNPAAREELARMPWDQLEKKIQGWIVLAHVLTRMLQAERELAVSVFWPPYDDLTFTEVVASTLEGLVQYGHAIASVKRTPEKVFALLDMQEHLKSMQRTMERVLEGATSGPLLNRVQALLMRLEKTAHSTFAEFEDAVSHNSNRHVVHDGTVHPLTAYVINYVKRLFSYRATLVTLFSDFPVSKQETEVDLDESLEVDTPGGNSTEMDGRIAGTIVNILMALLQNLEEKSRMYKEVALQNLFLMNNLNYVVGSMQSYGSSQLLPEEWVSRHRALVNTYKSQYLKASWTTVFEALRAEHLVPSSKLERRTVKQRFKTINSELKTLHSLHMEWAIPDSDLCEDVRSSVLAELLPLHNRFSAHYRDTYFTKKPDKYMIYTEGDLRKMVEEDFFRRT